MASCACSSSSSIWTVGTLRGLQKISDIFIAIAFLSISLQLLYYLTRSNTSTTSPVRLSINRFSSFISLCGLTHLFSFLTNTSVLSYRLILTLTVLKSLTAIVSCSTSVDLLTLIPQILRRMVLEKFLKSKTTELDQQLVVLKRREKAIRHVRMLTSEIRKSLDKHTILYTTLVELAKAFCLENCSVWMPDESNYVMTLTHELKPNDDSEVSVVSIPVDAFEVVDVVAERGVKVLKSGSRFGRGAGVAIRLPVFRVSDFRGGPRRPEQCYAILVLLLREGETRNWSSQELEIVEVVADQVAVALSHAAVVEESSLMREKLLVQNRTLKKARETALNANDAMCSFRKVMSREMIAPSRSIAAIISVLQTENWESEQQRRIVDTLVKGGLLLSAVIEDVTGVTQSGDSGLELKLCNFGLHSLLEVVVRVSKFLCSCRGLGFDFQVDKEMPDHVIGDEMRIIQALLYMVGKVSALGDCGNVILTVFNEGGSYDNLDSRHLAWKRTISEEFARPMFQVHRTGVKDDGSSLFRQPYETDGNGVRKQVRELNICEKLAQLMHGSASVSSSAQGDVSMTLTIRLPLQNSNRVCIPQISMDPETAPFLLKGMNTLLVDNDNFNKDIMRKLFGNLGCHLAVATSWKQCLEFFRTKGHKYRLLLVDLEILKEDGADSFPWIKQMRMKNLLFIIALAVNADKDIRAWCLRNGIHGVICKPVIFQELEDELQKTFLRAGRIRSPP